MRYCLVAKRLAAYSEPQIFDRKAVKNIIGLQLSTTPPKEGASDLPAVSFHLAILEHVMSTKPKVVNGGAMRWKSHGHDEHHETAEGERFDRGQQLLAQLEVCLTIFALFDNIDAIVQPGNVIAVYVSAPSTAKKGSLAASGTLTMWVKHEGKVVPSVGALYR